MKARMLAMAATAALGVGGVAAVPSAVATGKRHHKPHCSKGHHRSHGKCVRNHPRRHHRQQGQQGQQGQQQG